jgi:hypothetical protein
MLSYAIGQAASLVEVVGRILASLNALYDSSFVGGSDSERRDDRRYRRRRNHLAMRLIIIIMICIVGCRRTRIAVFP